MSDLDPDRITETRTSTGTPEIQVTRTVERSSGAAWWAVALAGVALIIAVTYVITRSPSPTNTDASVVAATQQIQSQAAAQQAQSAAAQAQSAADSAAQSQGAAAARAATPSPPAQAPGSAPSAPAQSAAAQSDDQGGGPPQ